MLPLHEMKCDFKALYKTDLHCHIDGYVRLDTVHEIVNTQKIIPVNPMTQTPYWTREMLDNGQVTKEFLAKIIHARTDYKDLVEYLRAFDVTGSVMQTPENLRRVVLECIEDAAADNVKHLELRYAPAFQTNGGMTQEQAHDVVCATAKEGMAKYHINVAIIICTMKVFKPDNPITIETQKLYKKQYPGLTIAYDEAGPENFEGCQFVDYEQQIKALPSFIPITLHAGEACGPENVASAIRVGAQRIGHGVRALEDPKVVEQVKKAKVVLEMCPTSNTQTNVVGINKDLSNYPLKYYLDSGVMATVCTDNPHISQCTVSGEYKRLVEKTGLQPVDVLLAIHFGFQHAFNMDEKLKVKLRDEAFEHNCKILEADDPEIRKHF